MKEKELAIIDIDQMSYVDFVSFIKEENRPPGGKKTVREFIQNSFINKESKVLEVGCTNGFTSLEISRIINCEVCGIDLHADSIKNAKDRVTKENVNFQVANAENLPFDDNSFDLVVSSNATSFMKNKEKAINEYMRVTKEWGFIAVCPMYYINKPLEKNLDKVNKVLGFEIEVKNKNDWLNKFKLQNLEIYYVKDYIFENQQEDQIDLIISNILRKPHINNLPSIIKDKIAMRWKDTLSIFNENLQNVGYSVILLRKRSEVEENELFISKEKL